MVLFGLKPCWCPRKISFYRSSTSCHTAGLSISMTQRQSAKRRLKKKKIGKGTQQDRKKQLAIWLDFYFIK